MESSSQQDFLYKNPLYMGIPYEPIYDSSSNNNYTEEQFTNPNQYNTLMDVTDNTTLPGMTTSAVDEVVEEICSLEKEIADAMKEYPNELTYELPKNWVRLTAPNGKYYYACKTTKHTQWLHPKIPIGTMMPNGLPYGWEKGTTRDGQVYYINHVGRFNTKKPPLDLLKRIISPDEVNEPFVRTESVMNSI